MNNLRETHKIRSKKRRTKKRRTKKRRTKRKSTSKMKGGGNKINLALGTAAAAAAATVMGTYITAGALTIALGWTINQKRNTDKVKELKNRYNSITQSYEQLTYKLDKSKEGTNSTWKDYYSKEEEIKKYSNFQGYLESILIKLRGTTVYKLLDNGIVLTKYLDGDPY